MSYQPINIFYKTHSKSRNMFLHRFVLIKLYLPSAKNKEVTSPIQQNSLNNLVEMKIRCDNTFLLIKAAQHKKIPFKLKTTTNVFISQFYEWFTQRFLNCYF